MTDRVSVGNLRIARVLYDFVNNEALPGTDIDPDSFWAGVDKVVTDLSPQNQDLLNRRDELQAQIDRWHKQRVIAPVDVDAYREFLTEIGYLQPEPEDFTITTSGVDDEIKTMAGPQLVVPVLNARFALNAANARWGSLYDALYGTDAIPEKDGAEKGSGYNKVRGDKVIAYARKFLDGAVPLASGSWSDADRLSASRTASWRSPARRSEQPPGARRPWAVRRVHRRGRVDRRRCCCVNHGLHIEILIDPESPIGKTDRAGVKDVVLESAITTIMDFEDSVAAVDAEDKVRRLPQLAGADAGATCRAGRKGRQDLHPGAQRRTASYTAPDGGKLTLPGRSLMFMRNVGHLMTNDAIAATADGSESVRRHHGRRVHRPDRDARPQGADGQRAAAQQPDRLDLHRQAQDARPDEVAFTDELFSRVEDVLGLAAGHLKIGIMDEERRTTVNLRTCIRAAADRIVFINTGFLDRTGDEIHTSMQAGPMVRKGEMKSQPLDHGLRGPQRRHRPGLPASRGRAQIGKGMWAMPDLMADMVEQKIAQPRAGANTAWVPSPTAATLHAMHYHHVDVAARAGGTGRARTAPRSTSC